ncbi:hypothetical protein MESS4_590037 [Mesorhizobium sp. STM 4661]|nr:hypothetical protein MESS4_590037 [Mesorhizobium sp. STM 4661]
MEDTGVRGACLSTSRSHFSDIECRSGLPTRITIPPKPFLVLLRTVTPIDHFLLIFSGLQWIEATVVAVMQQITRLQRRVINGQKTDYPYNFKELLIATQKSRRLT